MLTISWPPDFSTEKKTHYCVDGYLQYHLGFFPLKMIRLCFRNALLQCSLFLLPAEQVFARLALIVNAKSRVSVLTKMMS